MGRPKKVQTEINPVITNSTPLPEGVVVKFDSVQPLGLNLDLGRQDLNENFQKTQEKINELIKKLC